MQNGPSRREWLVAIGVIAAIKLAWLALDAQLRIYMGDSASYLFYATIDEAPPDRSYTYALLIRWFALPFGSLDPMIALQTVLGLGTALFVFAILRETLGVRLPIAIAAAAAVATEPAQLYYERMLMAESAGTFALVAMAAAGIAYVVRPHPRWLAYAAILGIGAASFRLTLLPVVLGLSIVPPIAALFRPDPTGAARRLGLTMLALGFSLAATLAAHQAYRHWYAAHAANVARPAYAASEGWLRLAIVAPLVKEAHLQGDGLPADLLDTVVPDLRDPRMRESQMWSVEGLIGRIQSAEPVRGPAIARKVAMRALRDDLDGFLAMQVRAVGDYFDDGVASYRMQDDLGVRAPPQETVKWFADVANQDVDALYERPTPVFVFFSHGRWWFTACLFALVPLALAAWWRSPAGQRAPASYLVLLAFGMVASQILFALVVSYRYLHAFPIFAILALALVFARRTDHA